ncbi:MAG: hypothetical protein R3F56_11830 [Planctomycetota bacterium]
MRCACLGSVLALGAALTAQARDERRAAVGMRARIEQVVIAGPEAVARALTADAPLVVRVLATYPHGADFRYDLEYYGVEPGTYDLKRFLQTKSGAAVEPPSLDVEIVAALPPGQVTPNPLSPKAPAAIGGYRDWAAVGVVAWLVGLLAILFGRRPTVAARQSANAPPTLADRLQPMVQAAADGTLDAKGKAELERLLLAFWRQRLHLDGLKADEAMARLRTHAEAGALLRQLEAWLHRPGEPTDVDVATLLQPYRSVAAGAPSR